MHAISPELSTSSRYTSEMDKSVLARDTAIRLEANFLSEMLKASGFDTHLNSFPGSEGQDQFASFHRQAIAEQIAKAGGLGLAEHFFRAIMEAQNDE
jgi:Rod binding domain-containing protein